MICKAKFLSKGLPAWRSLCVSENIQLNLCNRKSQYYNVNSEKMKEANKLYCKSEMVKAKQLAYKANNKAAESQRMSTYRDQNKEKVM
jgi:hypothetical protein